MKVVLRQKSMIEKAVEQGFGAAMSEGDGIINEFDIVEDLGQAVAKSTAAQAKRNITLAKELKKIFPNANVSVADGVDPTLVKEVLILINHWQEKCQKSLRTLLTFLLGQRMKLQWVIPRQLMSFPRLLRLLTVERVKSVLMRVSFHPKKNLQERMQAAVDSGMHRAGVELEPARTVSTHEFGHVINYALGFDTGQGLAQMTWETLSSVV